MNYFRYISSKLKEHSLKLIITLIITLILLYILLGYIDFSESYKIFRNFSIWFLIVSFILYVLGYIFRAWRFYFILGKELSFRKLFNIVCIHGFFNNILPLRLGELSYIYLLKKENVQGTKGLFTLGAVRLFDVIAIFIYFSISLILTTLTNSFFNMFLILFFFSILFLIISIIFFRKAVLRLIHKLKASTKVNIIKTISQKLIEVLQHFGILKSGKTLFILFVMSLFTWAFVLLTGYVIVRQFIDVSFPIVVIGLTFSMLTYMLPIQGLLGFGTTEGAWALVLIFFGFTNEQSIATGFAYHILGIIYSLFLAIYALFNSKKINQNNSQIPKNT